MLILLATLLLAKGEEMLEDGVPKQGNIESMQGGSKHYRFVLDRISVNKDISISVTTFSDWSDPDIFVAEGRIPTVQDYDYSSVAWGMGSVIIPDIKAKVNLEYNVLVHCYSSCRFEVTFSYVQEIALTEGVPQTGFLIRDLTAIYKMNVTQDVEEIRVKAEVSYGKIKMYAAREEEPTPDNTLAVVDTWHNGKEFFEVRPKKGLYRFSIVALNDTQYTITASSGNATVFMLQASVPASGRVPHGEMNFYKINVDSEEETLTIKLTPFSGDPDLYIKAGELPTKLDFDFESVMFGNETLSITPEQRRELGHKTGDFFIGVYGFSESSYILTARINSNSLTPLSAGIPLTGYVEKQEIDLYYMNVPDSLQLNITFHLSPSHGNPDLYVKLCDKKLSECRFSEEEIANPSNHNVHVSKHSSGSDQVDILHTPEKCVNGNKCKYIAGILGMSYERSEYSILGNFNNSNELILREGRPMTMAVQNGFRYFKFTLFNESAIEVSFTLTPISGDSDLYSSTEGKPSLMNFDKKSSHNSLEIDSLTYVRGRDRESLVGTYHLGVFCSSQATFTIVAYQKLPGKNSTVQIYPGHPQKDTVYNMTDSDYRIYWFPVHFQPETKQNMQITLTPITGAFSVYVANNLGNLDWQNEIFYYNWRDHPSSGDPVNVVNIKTTDPCYVLDSTYLILVQADRFSVNGTATYSITYNIGNGTAMLTEDVPYRGQVINNEYNYFTFPIHANHEDITFSVTALSGDPDIYISVDPENTKPTKQKNDFRSNNFGSETLTLTWEQGLKEKCPDLPDEYHHGDPINCMIYIGVFGYSASTYTIRVHTSKNLPKRLTMGHLQSGELNRTEYDFYYITTSPTKPLKVTLQPLTGDPDLFLNVFNYQEVGTDPKSWERPTKDSFMYASRATTLEDSVELSSQNLTSICPGNTCLALISVNCFAEYCRYSIMAEEESNLTSLVEGDPKYGHVKEGEYMYFSYYCDKEDNDLLFLLTPISEGDPDLYVSKGRGNFPTSSNYTWRSISWSGESILIKPDDTGLGGGSMKGTYNIAVYGFVDTSFTIKVTNHPTPVTRIVSGQPNSGALGTNSVDYYSFYNSNDTDILITVTPNSGTAFLRANPQDELTQELYENLPTQENYVWSSVQNENKYIIEIKQNDPHFCMYCNILIGVFTSDSECSYSITAKNELHPTLLQNGVPVRAEIQETEVHYYTFEIKSETEFDISLVAYSGDPDIFVSKQKNVLESFKWQSLSTEEINHITITPEDEEFIIGVYYIAVEGFTGGSYSLTMHTRKSYVTLIDGWPQTYSIAYDSKDHILFQLISSQESRGNAYCELTPLSEDFKPSLYTYFYPANETRSMSPPDSYLYELKYEENDYDNMYNKVKFNLNMTGKSGKYRIGVYGNQAEGHSRREMGNFEFYCTTSMHSTILRVGDVQYDVFDNQFKKRSYEINVNEKGKLELFAIPCGGKIKLEVSSNWTLANEDIPDVEVTRMTDGRIIGSINHAKGKYFVTVSSLMNSQLFNGSSYQLTSRFTKQGDPTQPLISPGNEGILSWERKGGSKVELKWNPVYYENGKPYQEEVEYRVYFTDEEKANMVTTCGMYSAELLGIATSLKNTHKTQVTVELPEEKGFVNVMAVLPESQNMLLRYVSYDPTEVVVSAGHRGIGATVFWVVAVLLFVSIMVTALLYKKFRTVQQQLEYEMSDVRNVASVSSGNLNASNLSAAQRKQAYNPLFDQSDTL